ncbi:hypothetical protein AURDEDRAFT_164487 [Auricularia subglabra TFB-10046 SS5]|nr:hypothetical protein AURDEDRAFT_164487 [Auricularia subglabra TFB-10046 SS5]
MPPNAQEPLRIGDNVYLALSTRSVPQGYYEAIILDISGGHFTLAAHVRGPDERSRWVVLSHVARESLGSEPRRPSPRAEGVRRGVSCLYEARDGRGDEPVVNAIVLNHTILVNPRTSATVSVFDVAYRSARVAAGWEIAANVDGALIRLGSYGERLVIE